MIAGDEAFIEMLITKDDAFSCDHDVMYRVSIKSLAFLNSNRTKKYIFLLF
jgi:hypothetical protein